MSKQDAVPRSIHFIWIGSPIPRKYAHNVERFAEHNGPLGYAINLWTDHPAEPIEGVVVRDASAPHLLNRKLYDAESNWGAKADILRYEIVYAEGGIYNDIDAISLKAFDPAVFAGAFVSHTFEPWNNLTNAVFGFPAGHPFLKFVIDSMGDAAGEGDVARRTGPIFFTDRFVTWYGAGRGSWRDVCAAASERIRMVHQDLLIYPKHTNEKNRSVGYTYHTNDANWVGGRDGNRKEIRLSLCTAIKDRLPHLMKTLPQNIADARRNPHVEFVVLDYGSGDGLGEWIRPYVSNGLVNYYRAEGQPYWRNAHAKNVSTLVAGGGIVCNVDADNLIGDGFTEYLCEFFGRAGGVLTGPPAVEGVTGRVACLKADFIALGGYNEEFSFGWCCEDIDLVSRANYMGHAVNYIVPKYLRHLPHDAGLRNQCAETTDFIATNKKGLDIMATNLRLGLYVANRKAPWGACVLTRNYTEEVVTSGGKTPSRHLLL